MLKALFHWLDLHPGSYWVLVAAATVPLLARLWPMIVREAREPDAAGPPVTWRDGLWLFLFLLAWRWPFLLVSYDYNPDESQMIAGALTLARDPVFWRAVDGGSSGPLNYYLLVPWHWVGAPLDYFTARLTCLLLTWGALLACLQSLARCFGRTAAWLGILPAAAFFATVVHPELTNLSTEQLPVLLIALSFGLLAGRTPPDRWRLSAACLAAGALPWTKLQSAPIGLALIGWACWQVWFTPGPATSFRWRRSAEILLAAALPTLFFAGLAGATGQAEAAWIRFFLQNFNYVATGTSPSGGDALRSLWHNAWVDGSFPLFLAIVSAGLAAAAVALVVRRERPSLLWTAAAGVTLAALAAVITPRRDYLHYVLLLPIPFTLWFGVALGGWWRGLQLPRRRIALAGVALAAGVLPLAQRSLEAKAPIYGGFTHHWKYPRSNVAAVVHALAGRDDTLGTWGWACALHVECALPQATRDGTTALSIDASPYQAYHRAVYLADLQSRRPPVFVDAVGPGAFVYTDRERQAHESFPELAAFIRRNYTLVLEQLDARIYAWNDLPALRDLSPARLHQLVMQGRDPEKFLMSFTPAALETVQRKFIGPHKVALLPPATRVEWPLDRGMTAVDLEFGCDPAARPDRGSDAAFTLEVVDPAGTRLVLQRVLNPAHQAGDRGLQRTQVALPSFLPGSALVLRTDPARNGLYLAGLRLQRPPVPPSK